MEESYNIFRTRKVELFMIRDGLSQKKAICRRVLYPYVKSSYFLNKHQGVLLNDFCKQPEVKVSWEENQVRFTIQSHFIE